ncbi:hypothetical protein [Methanoculleus chikugoensis]|uniref:hypothetical protein n=1 Tax=Methanoculleus chikugoensis TaxID=118126 RepID=UPI0006D05861|nr:hypothetical protein [Methanoculleus chikugoensis]
MLATFISTQVLPLQYSIYVGVLLSLAIYLVTSTREASVVRLVPVGGGMFREEPRPDGLWTTPSPCSRSPGASTSQPSGRSSGRSRPPREQRARRDPRSPGGKGRGRNRAFPDAGALRPASHGRGGNRLILAEVDPRFLAGLVETGAAAEIGRDNIFFATPVVWESLMEAIRAAEAGA